MKYSLLNIISLIVWVAALNSYPAFAEETHAAAQETFVSIADLHFNPFAGCQPSKKPCALLQKLKQANYQTWDKIFDQYGEKQVSTVGQETNYLLFKKVLDELQQLNEHQHFHFGLVLGDFLAHMFRAQYMAYSKDVSDAGYQAFVKKTLQYMTDHIHHALPDIDVYPAVGNNDSYTEDYGVVPDGEFLKETAKTWAELIQQQPNRQSMLKLFPEGGYYTVALSEHPSTRVIVLNTVLFSIHTTKTKAVQVAAERELSWLHQQLQLAAQQKQHVLLAFHVPVGIDVYATIKNKLTQISEFWESQYSEAFEKELNMFPSVVMGILPAHIHVETLQLAHQLEGVQVNFTPAISPLFGNNPGFKVFSYDPNLLAIKKIETYFYLLQSSDKASWEKE